MNSREVERIWEEEEKVRVEELDLLLDEKRLENEEHSILQEFEKLKEEISQFKVRWQKYCKEEFPSELERILSKRKKTTYDVQKNTKSGWLSKSRRFFKTNTYYWFELDELSACLIYYNNHPSLGVLKSKIIGSIPLDGSKIDPDSNNKIIIKNLGKQYIIQAVDSYERDDWLENMIRVRDNIVSSNLIDRWNNEILGHTGGEESYNYSDHPDDDNDIEDMSSQVDFFNIILEGKKGHVCVRDVLNKNIPTLLILLRHFGCLLSKQFMINLMKRKNEFDANSIEIIAVGNGSQEAAQAFMKEFNFPTKNIYLDLNGQIYKALNCKRGSRYCVSERAIELAKQALDEGIKPSPFLGGDPFQLGGAFVISPVGSILYQHIENFVGDHPNLDQILSVVNEYFHLQPYETWCTVPPIEKDWLEVEQQKSTNQPPLILPNLGSGYHLELGRDNVIYSLPKLRIEEKEHNILYYKENFYGNDHTIYYIVNDEDSFMKDVGPFILAVEKTQKQSAKCILFTERGNFRFLIPEEYTNSTNKMKDFIRTSYPDLAHMRFVKVQGSNASELLCELEKENTHFQFKFGVIYIAKGQKDENSFYSNKEGSKAFNDFLSLLGKRVKLKHWPFYSAGLDTQNDWDGTHSIYLNFDKYEIMFHVSTYLNHKSKDPQQIEKKRHIGNDIAVICFKEDDEPFDPREISSRYNNIFAVVQPSKNGFYRLAFANKAGVPPYGPYLPQDGTIKKKELQEFLITKLINGENAAFHSPSFENRIRARKDQIERFVKQFDKGTMKRALFSRRPSLLGSFPTGNSNSFVSIPNPPPISPSPPSEEISGFQSLKASFSKKKGLKKYRSMEFHNTMDTSDRNYFQQQQGKTTLKSRRRTPSIDDLEWTFSELIQPMKYNDNQKQE